MFTQDGDIKFFYTGQGPADIQLAPGTSTLVRDPGFETAILISLFSQARAGAEDKLPDREGGLRGYWGDTLTARKLGSKLWLLDRARITNETRAECEEYAKACLQWMVEDGIATEIKATSTRNGIYRIDTAIKIIQTNKLDVSFKYYLNWKAQIFGGF